MDVAVLFSGAKDSTFAVYKAMQRGHNVKYLVSLIPENPGSVMFGQPNISLTALQAEAMGIPIRTKATKGSEENELDDLWEILSSMKGEIQGVVTGFLGNNYQRARIERVLRRLGLKHIMPSWKENMRDYWEEIILSGFEVIISSITSEGLDESWLGKKIDWEAFTKLSRLSRKHGLHRGFEAGEAESFVLDGPLFRKRVKILKAHREWDGSKGVYVIDDAVLEEK